MSWLFFRMSSLQQAPTALISRAPKSQLLPPLSDKDICSYPWKALFSTSKTKQRNTLSVLNNESSFMDHCFFFGLCIPLGKKQKTVLVV